MNLGDIEIIADIVKLYFINLFTYYLNMKVTNMLIKSIKRIIFAQTVILVITFICKLVKDSLNIFWGIIWMIFLIGIYFGLSNKYTIGQSIVITIFSLTINYIIFIISIFIIKRISSYIYTFLTTF